MIQIVLDFIYEGVMHDDILTDEDKQEFIQRFVEDADEVLLEHVYNPKKLIQEIYRVLRKEGYVLIKVPNAKFHLLALRIFKVFPFLMKNNFSVMAIKPPEHLYGYSKLNLKLLFESVGFEKVGIFPSPLTRRPGLKLFYYPVISFLSNLIYYLTFRKLNLSPTIYLLAKKPM